MFSAHVHVTATVLAKDCDRWLLKSVSNRRQTNPRVSGVHDREIMQITVAKVPYRYHERLSSALDKGAYVTLEPYVWL